MGLAKVFEKEILVMGVLSSNSEIENQALKAVQEYFGPIEVMSSHEIFTWTDYYNLEMGQPIYRFYLCFQKRVAPEKLADIKQMTNEIELQYAINGQRKINLDPGLLAPGRFCLATTKDRAHRIPLSNGIYAELTLIFQKKEFHPLPWTYPDWASEPVRIMLAAWRKKLLLAQNPDNY